MSIMPYCMEYISAQTDQLLDKTDSSVNVQTIQYK